MLALDVGGTKLAAGLVSMDGRLLRSVRCPTPATADPEHLMRTVLNLLGRAADGASVAGVGVGCGGPMRWPAGHVSPLNIPAWRHFPLRQRLVQAYPGVPVHVHNDAVCFAVGEHWRGAASGHASVLGIVVSTGVGGGLLLDGRTVSGAGGNAGHVGHVVVDPAGPSCACGGRGCLEAVASGPRTVAWAVERGWVVTDPSVPSGAALAEAARGGDPLASAALARSGRALGVAIASAVQLLDLDVVVVGGGLAQAGSLLFEPLHDAYAEHAGLEYARAPRVVRALSPKVAGLVGAAALVAAAAQYWPVERPGA